MRFIDIKTVPAVCYQVRTLVAVQAHLPKWKVL